MKFIKKVIFTFNILLIIGLLISYLSPYVDPNSYWLFSMFGLFYPVLLIGNIVLVLFWLFVEFKYLFPSLIAILIGWSHLTGFVNFSSPSSTTADLSVLSYNVNFFRSIKSGKKAQRNATAERIKIFFKEQKDVDVFCIQESDNFTRKTFKSIYPDYYGHSITDRGTYIYSKHPIIASGEVDFGTRTNSCVWADIQIKDEKVRIYSLHLQSNKLSREADKVLEDTDLQDKKTWNSIKEILNKYKNSSFRRAEQAALVSDHAQKSGLKTIICGDVNEPPTSYTYSRLCGDYQDSFVKAGSGIGTTYGGKIPMLRIDYIFADENFSVEEFEILKPKFSDHYPVIGKYTLEQ